MSDTTIATLRAMLANLDDAKKYQSLRDVMSTLPAPDLAAVFEAALDIPEIETIMFPYNIVEQQGKALIDRCAAAGKAFIDMKPLAGGAIEDGRLALRYVLSNPAVTVAIPGMATVDELENNGLYF